MARLVLHFFYFFFSKYFKIFPLLAVSCQLKLFLSADSASRFLSSADLLFVSRFNSKIFVVSRFAFCRQMPAYTVSRQSASCWGSFRLQPARTFAFMTIPLVLPDLPGVSHRHL
jgi:hypothetical protein